MRNKIANYKILLSIILLAFFIRIIPIDFPKFTANEARIAYRGYTLSVQGKDELGRGFPYIFNSSTDYQLPLTSYVTALGIKIFGKNDLGARIPFILIGTILVFMVYKASAVFSEKLIFKIFSASIVAFSPVLIFYSKIPNESIILILLFTLLFYLLTRVKINLFLLVLVVVMLMLASKVSWLITAPFVILTLILFPNTLNKSAKVKFFLVILIFSFLLFLIYSKIPQGKRSLSENDFYLFSDPAIKNGIAVLRGQSTGIFAPIGKILFNKLDYLLIAILNWLSHLHPAVLFSKFDETNMNGFTNAGTLQKVLILPLLYGFFYLLKTQTKQSIFLLASLALLTYPYLFNSYKIELKPVLLVLPFVSFIAAYGFVKLKKYLKIITISFFIVELGFTFLSFNMSAKLSREARPGWLRAVLVDGIRKSNTHKLAISDDLTSDLPPFIQWYSERTIKATDENISFPYKFRQTQLDNITVVGQKEGIFYKCGYEIPMNIIASKRDLRELTRWLNIKPEEAIKEVYKNDRGEEVAYYLEKTICVH